MIPWVGYTRVSRVGDRKDTLISPELQQQRIEGYAAGRGIDVEMLAPELDVSGGQVTRPVLEQAIEGIEAGRYAGIIVAQYDRLSRMDITDALATIRRVEAAGGQVIAVAESFDAGTPEGKMGRNVVLSMAEMQLDRYKLQFRAAKARAVEHGIWPVPRVPFGYRKRPDRRLEPDPQTRGKVVQAFEQRAAGRSWSAIAPTVGVGPSGVARIVGNRVYLGEIRYGEWVNPTAHEPLVTRALWEAAQLGQPRPARRGNPPALLGGLVRCAGCRCVMTRSTSDRGWAYRCNPRKSGQRCPAPAMIGTVHLEAHVERLALDQVARLAYTAAERNQAVELADQELQGAEAELDAYQRAVRVSEIGAGAFNAGMRTRTEAVELARRALAGARLAAGPLPEPGTLRELWPGMTVEERRHVLRGALTVVWVRKGRGAGRVKVIAAGHDDTLPAKGRPGWKAPALGPVEWVEDMPGEIGTAGAEDVVEGPGGA